MEIVNKAQGNELIISLTGKLTAIEAPQLQAALEEARKEYDVIVIDMENLAYLSSAGLRVIVSNHKELTKRENGKQILRNMNPEVREVFTVTGLMDILTIEE